MSERSAGFLAALTEEERSALWAAGRVRRFSKGEAIFHKGDDPGGVVAVLSGTVKVSVMGVGGREVVLSFPGPGELVGELAAVGDRPRTATATAVDEVEAIAVRAADFRRFVLDHPRVAGLVFEHVAALLAGPTANGSTSRPATSRPGSQAAWSSWPRPSVCPNPAACGSHCRSLRMNLPHGAEPRAKLLLARYICCASLAGSRLGGGRSRS